MLCSVAHAAPTVVPSERPADSSTPQPPTKAARILSIDALRGFDMFWIVGGDALIHALHKYLPNVVPERFAEQFRHVEWAGFRFYDLIFPLFVFLVGSSLVFSLSRSLEIYGRRRTLMKVLQRSVILFLLGVIYNGGWGGPYGDGPRLMGVLQRIALSYCFASILFCFLRPRALVACCVGILVFYWGVMAFTPLPETADRFSETDNVAAWVDSQFLPYAKYQKKPYDPEGLLSSLPAIATCLLGVFAGLMLKEPSWSSRRKLLWLLLVGVGLLTAGWGWSFSFPIIKKIWTSSFVLVAGGASYGLLALFYFLIDVCGWKRWTLPFVWIGMNAITIYLLSAFLNFRELSRRLAGGPVTSWLDLHLGAGAGNLALAIVTVALVLLICRFLYERKVFIKI